MFPRSSPPRTFPQVKTRGYAIIIGMDDKPNTPTEEEKPQRKSLRFESNISGIVDRQIREAMERGDFDNLRGAGKPLNLHRDPGVPEEWELAFNLLKNAGYAPDWIETRKEVDASKEKLFAPFKRYLANPPKSDAERMYQQSKLVDQFRKQAAELNKLIDTYNLKAPAPQVHLRRIRIDHEVEQFLKSV